MNKVDARRPDSVLVRLATVAEAVDRLLADAPAGVDGPDVEYFPVSAATGGEWTALVEAVVARLPEGPAYYPEDMVSDAPEALRVAELVREQLLAGPATSCPTPSPAG